MHPDAAGIDVGSAISDVVGVTGQKILRAIVAGERDPQELASYRDFRIKADEQEIAKSLQGNWRAEHLFALKQALDAFDFCGAQLAECDAQMQRCLRALHTHERSPAKANKRSTNRNAPKFDVRDHLYKVAGVDLTRIDGIDVSTALVVLSEIGPDLSRFPSVKHFASWLGLCPGTKISGGKVLGAASKRSANRAAQALKLAAAALRSSKSALGAYHRRMLARMDKPRAVTATVHKLARLVYVMMTRGEEFVDHGQLYYEQRYKERVDRHLTLRARQLGMELVPAALAA
ncbi:MAG: IS110 family transposase ISCARN20 [Burkholderiaceae bacterium]|nr:IS110 family transposase ISCARN20 [Burkholderiaceae bacterium]